MNDLGPIDTSGNLSFKGSLQHVWDSTSIGALKTCPKYYELSIVRGYVPRKLSVDLAFGLYLHSARECYYHARALGEDHETALTVGLIYLLKATFDTATGRPWNSEDANKNRLTLVRTFVWYVDQWANDPLRTIHLANGAPAVELTFRFPTDYLGPNGQPYELAGHIDRLVTFNDETWVSDLKSTKSTLDQSYFLGFTPDNQMSLYSFASKVVYSSPAKGILIDAAQVAVTFSRFQRGIVPRSADQLDEWYGELRTWLDHAEGYASEGHWPMNERSCFRCAFRPICSKPPSVRAQWLATDYVQRTWDPSVARGDI